MTIEITPVKNHKLKVKNLFLFKCETEQSRIHALTAAEVFLSSGCSRSVERVESTVSGMVFLVSLNKTQNTLRVINITDSEIKKPVAQPEVKEGGEEIW